MNMEQKVIKNKLGVLELARQLGNVSQACNVMGFLWDSFYRFKQLYDQGDELALADINRKGKPQPKNRIDPDIEKKIVEIALDNPALGQQRDVCLSLRCRICMA